MLKKLLSLEIIQNNPPILVDVGASGDIPKNWKKIAKHSICIAFDADERALSITTSSGKNFKNFYLINRIVSDKNETLPFYLTKSPYCSSLLVPNIEKLKNYDKADLFKIEKTTHLPATTLNEVLSSLKINSIDWLKTDTQGTDLTIFNSLKEIIKKKCLVVELEPGIIDAYDKEEKLSDVMKVFEDRDFWADECAIKGLRRINKNNLEKIGPIALKYPNLFQKSAAYWAEISYMNNMNEEGFSKRDFIVMIIFALIKNQYGFVLELSQKAFNLFPDPVFNKIYKNVLIKMKIRGYLKLPFFLVKHLIVKLSQ